MLIVLAALTSLQNEADQLLDRHPNMAQIAVIVRSKSQSCDDLTQTLSASLEPSRTGLILAGCSKLATCQAKGRVVHCPGSPLANDKAMLFSWYGDLLFEGASSGFGAILKAKDSGAPKVAIEAKGPRNKPDGKLAKALRGGLKRSPFRLVTLSKNAQTAASLQDRWMANAMQGGSACAFGRDGQSTHLIKAKLGGRHASRWLRLTLSGSQSNCALATTTLRLGRKPVEPGVAQALDQLVKATRRPIRVEVDAPKAKGPGRVKLTQTRLTLGCNQAKDKGCKRHESPPKAVTVKTFLMDRTEVTVAAYRACVESEKCDPPFVFNSSCNWSRKNAENHPMNCIAWQQAKIFCQAHGGQLPSEAQWERAARGRSARLYAWGDQAPSCERAMMRSDAPGCGMRSTAQVGSRPLGRSPEGILDLTGNVAEWVEDAYAGNGFGAINKPDDDPEVERVQRGGSWYRGATDLRAGHRERHPAGRRGPGVGFRCVYEE